jgi:hypothetical protein
MNLEIRTLKIDMHRPTCFGVAIGILTPIPKPGAAADPAAPDTKGIATTFDGLSGRSLASNQPCGRRD